MTAKTSPEIAKDPSQSLHIEDRFEARLHRLFLKFKKKIPDLVGKPQTQKVGDLPAINLDAFRTNLDVAITETILTPGEKIITETVVEAYQHGILFAVLWGRRVGKDIPLTELPADLRTMEILQARDLSELKGITDVMSKEMTRTLSDGVLAGRTFKEVTQDMLAAVDDIGLTRASTLVRTETMRAVNEATRERYDQFGIEKFQRLEAIDEKTCEDWEFNVGGETYYGCAAIDGLVCTPEEAAEVDAQAHPNCRGCWTIYIEETPVTDEGGD
jgi:SPP1 gp7 family putative phage head morphogenesis protein